MDNATLKKVRLMQAVRLAGIGVLFLPLPLTMRLLILYVIDIIDCNPIMFPFKACLSDEYQLSDKIVDWVTYLAILIYLLSSHPSQPFANALLCAMLVYRGVGITKYVKNKDPTTFMKYPDIFREFSLLVAMMIDGYIPKTPLSLVISTAVATGVKIVYERIHHSGVIEKKRYLRKAGIII